MSLYSMVYTLYVVILWYALYRGVYLVWHPGYTHMRGWPCTTCIQGAPVVTPHPVCTVCGYAPIWGVSEGTCCGVCDTVYTTLYHYEESGGVHMW